MTRAPEVTPPGLSAKHAGRFPWKARTTGRRAYSYNDRAPPRMPRSCKTLSNKQQPGRSPVLLRLDIVELAVFFPSQAQRLGHLAVHFQAHGLQLLRRLGDQLQRVLPGLDTLLLGCILERPLDLLGLLAGIQLTDFFEQLRIGLGKTLQRQGLARLFCDHLRYSSGSLFGQAFNRLKSNSFYRLTTSSHRHRMTETKKAPDHSIRAPSENMGWTMGIEPTTTGITIRRSTN
ncbi:hypothetical protein EMIT047CA2_240039 [Pseudomonas soli]